MTTTMTIAAVNKNIKKTKQNFIDSLWEQVLATNLP